MPKYDPELQIGEGTVNTIFIYIFYKIEHVIFTPTSIDTTPVNSILEKVIDTNNFMKFDTFMGYQIDYFAQIKITKEIKDKTDKEISLFLLKN